MTRECQIGPIRRSGTVRLTAVVVGLLLPWGAGAQAQSAPAAAETPRQELPAPALEALRAALGAYEEIRAALAADQLEAIPAGATRLARTLRQTAEDGVVLAVETSDMMEETASLAEALVAAEDLAASRLTFGEVSRRILMLANTDPRLVEGWYVFGCPMTEGFERWIQPTEKLENPYMGQAMLACGGPSDWSLPPDAADDKPAPARQAEVASRERMPTAGPEFRPGIPGLTMTDVREHRHLWREIEELQIWERGDRITVAEFRNQVLEKTNQFLGFEGAAAERFAAVAVEAMDSVRESRRTSRQGQTFDYYGGGWSGEDHFATDLAAAAERVSSVLQGDPRHQLFASECQRWLLKLTFGPRAAKEAREAGQVQTTRSGRQGEGGGPDALE
jgi:hypothetical protein